ncbi:GumC family protein [Paludibaculum fermentans]|uniref:non-specific protein-tyrosine kinase n=1 Tax=Paludibaculum fermentans TaxID=1473598 RepID=A0A7S7SJS1_PALFE|nr:GNVR domain-containing protein [Paludibaculum fermentans]QOY86260.1 AAA family ATPase [Paludibaculum fermentans]
MNDEQGDLVPARKQGITFDAQAYAPPAYSVQGGYPQEFQDDPDEGGGLVEYWQILRRRMGTLILLAGAGFLLAVLVTLPQTPVYQAKTTLEVLEMNQNFMNMGSVQPLSEGGNSSLVTDIQTQIQILQSESLTRRVLEEMQVKDVDRDSGTATGRISAWRRALNLPDVVKVDARTAAVKMAAKTLKARANGQTKIIEVLVDSTDKQVAAEFANRLTEQYITMNMDARFQMTERTSQFLGKQIADMRGRLEKSEDGLQAYARRTGLLLTGDEEKKNVSEEKLSQLQTELTRAQSERVQKQSRWEMASSAAIGSLPDILNDKILQEFQTRVSDLQRQKAELNETYEAGHPKLKKVEAQLASVEQSLARQRGDILARIKNEYEEAARREKLLLGSFKEQTGVVTDQSEKAIQYNILKREVDTNRALYDSMLQKLKEASLASALRASNVRVVDAAMAPKRPYKPNLPINAALGLICGLFAGVVLVVMTERTDRTLHDPSDIGYYLNVPELGMIPSEDSSSGIYGRLNGRAGKLLPRGKVAEPRQPMELVTFAQKPSALAESFRSSLTSILFTGQGAIARSGAVRPKVLVVTSPSPGEGKTTVASNLAIAMAETGQRVLLVDADTRKPRLHEIFEKSNEAGLTTVLQGRDALGEPVTLGGDNRGGHWSGLAMIQATQVPGLSLMTSGPPVAGATNLLYSQWLADAMERFAREYDVVFVDTPPMLQIPDARVIGRLASGVILVVRAGKTTRDSAISARTRLREDGIRVLGTIMNDWNPKRGRGGASGYYDGYSKYRQKYEYHSS